MNDPINRSEFLKKMAAGSLGMGAFFSSPFYSLQSSAPFQFQQKRDFGIRSFHIDLKAQVMTVEALKNFADELSRFGINAIVLEYEASYPYENHATLSNEYAYTRDEINGFVSYCESLGIEVIPLIATLGHVQYILRHERYAGLKIEHDLLSQLDPLNEDAFTLYDELIRDLISLHPSEYIHLGGDEARHLEHPKYRSYNKKHGPSRLYVQYMKRICEMAIKRGKRPLLWADMILKYPDAIEDLPIDKIILIDWNYGWEINHFGDIGALQKKGCTFWGAPALRSSPDNYYLIRWEKHFNNIRDFIPYSLKSDYEGIMMTSWSTSGIYGYQWEGSEKDLLNMFPIRNPYPLSGFRILTAAYSHALDMERPLSPRRFVIDYAQQRFGVTAADGETLWNYFAHHQVLLENDHAPNPGQVDAVRNKFQGVYDPLSRIIPDRNEKEFEHFLLMGAIRIFYLRVKKVEALVESDGFDRSEMKKISQHLKPLLDRSEELNESFKSLNKGYLHDAELERLNNLRNARLYNLCEIYCND